MTNIVDHWISPDDGTPDIYHKCSTGDAGVPTNWAGGTKALDGDAYLGIYLWRYLKYRENLLTKLTEPLIADSTYEFGCYVSHAPYSEFRSRSLEFGFSKNMISFDMGYETSDTVSTVRLKIPEPVKFGWSLVKGNYTAKGGESYFSIGSIKEFIIDTVKWKYFNMLKEEPQLNRASYYYLDSVFVSGLNQRVEKEITLTLKDVHFQFDDWNLTELAMKELDSLVQKVSPFAEKIFIEGHTDDIGSDSYNLNLSLRRAESVKAHFLQVGLELDPEVVAIGEEEPLVSNSSNENRAINRRVVVRVLYSE